jgi:UDP-N-acetylmuramoyl-L-alanyl-D-glutamate--2,6-diaminopimelate ligase
MSVLLGDLTGGLRPLEVIGPKDVVVAELASDSREVISGSLFACIRGGRVDGHDFAGKAARAGALVILCDHRLQLDPAVTQVIVPDVRKALAYIASRFFRMPSEEMTVIGITGTNGKTTTVHYLRSIIEAWGRRVGAMGTLGHWIGDSIHKDQFTTPEAPWVHRYMRWMLEKGLSYCVMEVSSHAIELARVDHVSFDAVAFTNLTRDHLDFHGDFDAYRRSKMRLFGIEDADRFYGNTRKAAVNIGDETGRLIKVSSPLECITYCLDGDADVRGRIVDIGGEGTTLEVQHAGETTALETSLRGRMNAENALAAFAVATLLAIDNDSISKGIGSVKSVPGRMEMIVGSGRQAVVDYAHTPDALEHLLMDARGICSGRLICVFGCGGDRDRGKRPEMGAIAGRMADLTIVTSDNPRTEDPRTIIEEIVEGLPEDSNHEVTPDRMEAIQRAVECSRPGDLIVIAGKGHEDYQIVGTKRLHFDDREAVRKAFGVIANAKA